MAFSGLKEGMPIQDADKLVETGASWQCIGMYCGDMRITSSSKGVLAVGLVIEYYDRV